MQRPILIFGTGQIGSALAQRAKGHGFSPVILSQEEMDIATASHRDILAKIDTINACCVINASAYTQVDKAESEGREEAFGVNAVAPGVLAAACAARNVLFVHYSTDYVYDGSGSAPRREEDAPAPLNAYGQSKLEGDRAVEAAGGQYLIFRTSWVYDAWGKNFLTTMLRLGKERETLNIVNDQIGAPSYAPHLAEATLMAVKYALTHGTRGIFHMTGAGHTSWHGFAQAIFDAARAHGEVFALTQLNAIPTSAYPTPAARPLNSRLDGEKLRKTFGIALPAWQEGLRDCMKERYARH